MYFDSICSTRNNKIFVSWGQKKMNFVKKLFSVCVCVYIYIYIYIYINSIPFP